MLVVLLVWYSCPLLLVDIVHSPDHSDWFRELSQAGPMTLAGSVGKQGLSFWDWVMFAKMVEGKSEAVGGHLYLHKRTPS